jgi:hypothetical protein
MGERLAQAQPQFFSDTLAGRRSSTSN